MLFPPSRFMCLFNVAEDGSSGRGEGRRFLSGRGRMTVPLPESRGCLPRLQQVDFLSPSLPASISFSSFLHPSSATLSLSHKPLTLTLSLSLSFSLSPSPLFSLSLHLHLPPSPSLPRPPLPLLSLALSPWVLINTEGVSFGMISRRGPSSITSPPWKVNYGFHLSKSADIRQSCFDRAWCAERNAEYTIWALFHTMKTHKNKPDYNHYSKSSTSHLNKKRGGKYNINTWRKVKGQGGGALCRSRSHFLSFCGGKGWKAG